MSDLQKKLGWEHIDVASTVFHCKWHKYSWNVKDGRPEIAAIHRSLNSALLYNGNIARNWEAEGGIKEETLIGGVWLLRDGETNRVVVTLGIDYVPASQVATEDIEQRPVTRETGVPGKLTRLHTYLAK
jgi:hypothetical protein